MSKEKLPNEDSIDSTSFGLRRNIYGHPIAITVDGIDVIHLNPSSRTMENINWLMGYLTAMEKVRKILSPSSLVSLLQKYQEQPS